MYVAVQHRITDSEKFFSVDPEEVAQGAPEGVQPRQFFPSADGSAALCLWEGESIDAVRGYIDEVTAGVAENSYFEVDASRAMGLPQEAAA